MMLLCVAGCREERLARAGGGGGGGVFFVHGTRKCFLVREEERERGDGGERGTSRVLLLVCSCLSSSLSP